MLRAGVPPARPRRPRRCHRDRALRRWAGAAHQGCQAAGIAARLTPPPPLPGAGLLRFLRAAQGGSTFHEGEEASTASAISSELPPKAPIPPIPPLMGRCLLVRPGLGADPLTARAALLHRRRAAQGTRQAAAAARATAAIRAVVGGPTRAPRQCAALTAHAALVTPHKCCVFFPGFIQSLIFSSLQQQTN